MQNGLSENHFILSKNYLVIIMYNKLKFMYHWFVDQFYSLNPHSYTGWEFPMKYTPSTIIFNMIFHQHQRISYILDFGLSGCLLIFSHSSWCTEAWSDREEQWCTGSFVFGRFDRNLHWTWYCSKTRLLFCFLSKILKKYFF